MFQVLRQRVLLDVFLNVPARQVRLQVLLHHKVQGCLQAVQIRWVTTNTPSLRGVLYPSPRWGKQQESLRYPLCEAGGGRGTAVLPQPPAQHRVPSLTLSTSSPEDAVLRVTQPIL